MDLRANDLLARCIRRSSFLLQARLIALETCNVDISRFLDQSHDNIEKSWCVSDVLSISFRGNMRLYADGTISTNTPIRRSCVPFIPNGNNTDGVFAYLVRWRFACGQRSTAKRCQQSLK